MTSATSSSHFVVTVHFKVQAEYATKFHEAVRAQAANTLDREPECSRFDVCIDPTDATSVFLYELYTDEAAFKHHLTTEHFLSFNALVGPHTLDKQIRTWVLGS